MSGALAEEINQRCNSSRRMSMRLSGRCCKCGSECAPRWQKLTDRMRYSCVCGYEWSSAPLDGGSDRDSALAEFQRRMAEQKYTFGKVKDDQQPLKVMLTNGTGRGEINFQ